MYQNIYTRYKDGKIDVHLWDDDRGYMNFEWDKYAYKIDPNGQYKSIFGDRLKKVNWWSKEEVQNGQIFLSDIDPGKQVLLDIYDDQEPADHRVMFYDIETSLENGKPQYDTPEELDPVNPITSIAFYDIREDFYEVIILDKEDKLEKKTRDNVVITPKENERQLLKYFLKRYREIKPTILSGWNSDYFDNPYLYKRIKRVFNEKAASFLSHASIVDYDKYVDVYRFAGVSSLDYMSLYRKFTQGERVSYKLDDIADDELGHGKIEYNGSLDDLFQEDIDKFIEYNLTDVKLLVELDDKLNLIDLTKSICYLGYSNLEEIYTPSRYIEGAILAYLRDTTGEIAPNKPYNRPYEGRDMSLPGAFVKQPKPGKYKWLYDLDYTSLYPSIIRSLNISPETKLGRVLDWEYDSLFNSDPDEKYTLELEAYRDGQPIKEKHEMKFEDLKNLITSKNLGISSVGVLYKQNEQGVIPSVVTEWFQNKNDADHLMKKHGRKDGEKHDELHEKYSFERSVWKILINSVYGAFGLRSFRFHDFDNAYSVTKTGQTITKYAEKKVNDFYNSELGIELGTEDHCIYIDTDSVFFSALPLMKERHGEDVVENFSDQEMVDNIFKIAREIENKLNDLYPKMGKEYMNLDQQYIEIKQELVGKSGLWLTKKRYATWVIAEKGVPKDELDVKGLDVVRSDFPKAFRDFLEQVLDDILKDVPKAEIDDKILDFRNEMEDADVKNIAKATGVSDPFKYLGEKKPNSIFSEKLSGCPGATRALLNFNDMLETVENKKQYSKMGPGEKIKWVYLRDNPYGITQIAFKGYDDPPEIKQFVEKYVDYDRIWDSEMRKKLKKFYDALGWTVPTQTTRSFNKFFTT